MKNFNNRLIEYLYNEYYVNPNSGLVDTIGRFLLGQLESIQDIEYVFNSLLAKDNRNYWRKDFSDWINGVNKAKVQYNLELLV